MALFGVVFALGAGSAVAQDFTPDPTYDTDGFKVEGLDKTITEGDGAAITVSMRARIDGGLATMTTVTVAVAEVAPAAETPNDASDNAEEVDIILSNATVELVFSDNPTLDGGTTPNAKVETKSATVFLQTTNDVDAEREDFGVTFTVSGGASLSPTGTAADDVASGLRIESTIVDDEEQKYVLTVTDEEELSEGDTIEGTVTAAPAHVNMAASLRLHVEDADYSLNSETASGFAIGNSSAIPGAVTSHSFTITPPTNDGNRKEDTVTVTLYSGSAGNSDVEDSKALKVADDNALPEVNATVILLDEDGGPLDDQPEDGVGSIMEGQTVDLKINVLDQDRKGTDAKEKLMVMLTPTGDAGAQDYLLSMHPVEIDLGDDSATVELTASLDQDIGMEMLVFDATVSGDGMIAGKAIGDETRVSADIVSLAIMDTTMKLVEAKSDEDIRAVVYAAKDAGEGADEMFSPGEVITVDASMLFKSPDGVGVVYTAMSDMPDVAGVSTSGSMVTVTAGEPGMGAHITITATAQPPAGAMSLPQTSPNVAQAIFPVDVVLAALSVDVTADPMDIMEGGMSTITATASREVAMSDGEVKVDLAVVGDGDLSATSITIAAGDMMGTATVTAMEDDDYEDETLTVIARGAGEATIEIMVTDNDEAPEPTNVITAKSSDDIYPLIMAAGLAGDDAMFNPGMSAGLDASKMFDVMEGYSASYGAESDAMNVASTSVSGSMVTVTAAEAGMAHVVITATATMASGVMPGQPATNVATVMFPVNVVNMPLAVTVSTDPMDMVEEGGMITVTAMANRMVLADDGDVEVMLTITGAVEMNEMMISIAAGMDSGTAMIQVLDDMEVAPLAAITIVATGSGIAPPQTATIAVTEDDSPRTFTLMASDDMMQLVEGGDGVELTVTADPAVSVDTEVTIMVDRAASTADADDFTAAPITIMAGEASGTTMLMATEDMMDDSGHGSPEMLVVFAMADNTQSNTVSFYIWDMAVPALPLIAQLLLAAFLAIGGYRRYLRR